MKLPICEQAMTAEQHASYLEQNMTCVRCNRILKVREFKVSTSHGKAYRRRWCVRCVDEYLQSYEARRRLRRHRAAMGIAE